MLDFAKRRDPLEHDLEHMDDMLAGLADEHSDFRSAEEIRGGIAAVRRKLRETWRKISLRPRGQA